MHRPDHSTADPDGISAGVAGYTEGDPGAFPPVPRTIVTKDALNDLTESLCRLVEAAGITLVKSDYDQVTDAVRLLATLQNAWDSSVAVGEESPHIDITGGFLRVGAATPAIPMLVMNQATSNVFFGADLDVYTGKTLTLPAIASLLITGTGASGRPKAVTMTSGVASETNLEQGGAWTPVVASTAGTGCDVGDFTSLGGHWTRVGNTITFTIRGDVDTTGWLNNCQAFITPPVTGTVSSVAGTVQGWRPTVSAYDRSLLFVGAGNTLRVDMTPSASLGASTLDVSGQYLLA